MTDMYTCTKLIGTSGKALPTVILQFNEEKKVKEKMLYAGCTVAHVQFLCMTYNLFVTRCRPWNTAR
jgi:hypothetical protein